MFFYLSVSDRFIHDGWSGRADMPLLSVCESVWPCEVLSEREMRGGHARGRRVIRSSIDSYERIVLAHRGTIAANLCCAGLRV
jgi:hypothetical protein